MLGDGHGFARAQSVGTWLACRWENFVRTFVPGGGWWRLYPFSWFEDRIDGAALYVMHSSRSLFGAIGIAASLAALALSRRLLRQQFAMLFAVMAGAVVILTYWGFSRTGLGRQCVEPLAALVLAMVAARLEVRSRWALPLLALAAVEIVFLAWAAIDWSEVVQPDFLVRREWTYPAIYLGLSFVPLAVVWIHGGSQARRDHQSAIDSSSANSAT